LYNIFAKYCKDVIALLGAKLGMRVWLGVLQLLMYVCLCIRSM